MDEKILLQSKCKKISTIIPILGFLFVIVGLFLFFLFVSEFDAGIFCMTVLPATVGLVMILVYFYAKDMELTVTDKRVYGKGGFGQRVDLPMDSVSAVKLSPFGGIAVSTASGFVRFFGINNNSEFLKVVNNLLIARQNEKNNATIVGATITDNMSSGADELKKFKDLLDSGTITQEEFDTKKKQILGL